MTVYQNSTLRFKTSGRSRGTSRGVTTALLLLVLGATAALVSADAVAGPDWTDCPSSCKCKWISGKKTAICREAGLTTVPSSLNADIQVLDLSGNPVPVLAKDAFRSVGLLNLQRIYLRGCGVKEINRDAFRDLTILIEVDLSSNGLNSIHPLTFSGNNRLRVLDLSGNPLNELREEQFPALPHLRTLEMRSCRLKHVHKRAFVHLSALEALNLSNNRLRFLAEAVFTPFVRIKTLALDGNPWKCDCRLRGFRSWLLNSKLYSLPLTCSEPESLSGHAWQDIDPMDFACSPIIELSDTMVQGEVGGNATFGCLVKGDPEPQVHWLFNGHLINNNGSDPDRIIDEDGEGSLEKWINITLSNLTDSYVGEYSCIAKNTGGKASKNLTLILPEVVTATTLSKAESWLLMAGLVAGGTGAIISALLGGLCLCLCSRQRRRRRKRKSKLTGSVSYTEQEKKLLDVSLTERASGTVSFEGMSQTDMELLTRDPSTVDLSEPVHITIENLPTDMINSVNNISGGNSSFPGAPYVIPPPLPPIQAITSPSSSSSQSSSQLPRGTLVAPPPEFSSTLPTSTFGNIFISVQVSQDPNNTINNDADNRYPDLLDIPHRSKTTSGNTTAAAISVTTGSEGLRQFPYHPHHHHHHHHPHSIPHHHHTLHHGVGIQSVNPNNIGGTTAIAAAATTISPYYPTQELSRCCAGSLAQLYSNQQCDQCVPDTNNTSNNIASDTMLAACATLPRRPRSNSDKMLSGPVVRMGPHYDNMGPRITAGGASVLSLPEATADEEREEEEHRRLNNEKRNNIMQDIPTPPPPPLCTPLPPEFVSL